VESVSFFAVNLAALLYALYQLYLVVQMKRLAWGLSTFIYMYCLVAVVVFMAELLTVVHSCVWVALDSVSNMIYSCSFYLVLLVWINMLARVQLVNSTMMYRLIIYFALAVSIVRIIYLMASLSSQIPHPVRTIMDLIFRMVLIPSQLLTSGVFLLCLVTFLTTSTDTNVPAETCQTLNRLMYLSTAGAATFGMVAVVNMILSHSKSHDAVGMVVFSIMLRFLTTTLRGLALLILLRFDVKPLDVGFRRRSEMEGVQSRKSLNSGGGGGE